MVIAPVGLEYYTRKVDRVTKIGFSYEVSYEFAVCTLIDMLHKKDKVEFRYCSVTHITTSKGFSILFL
jgi:hypothetical protein